MGIICYLACHKNKTVFELGKGQSDLGQLLADPKTRPTSENGLLEKMLPYMEYESKDYGKLAAAILWAFLDLGRAKFELGMDSGDEPYSWYEKGYYPVGSLYDLDNPRGYQHRLQRMIEHARSAREEVLRALVRQHDEVVCADDPASCCIRMEKKTILGE